MGNITIPKATFDSMNNQIYTLNQEIRQMKLQHERDLNRLSNEYERQVSQLKTLSDQYQIERIEKQIFSNFVKQLKTFDNVNPIPKLGNMKFVAIIGQSAAGKSSILNRTFGLHLEEGVDDTTQKIEKVHEDAIRKLVYFDSPGLNQTFNITHAEYLKAFYTIDIMFIATSVTFKNSIRSIQVMNKIKPPKLYLIRNQCDKFANEVAFKKAVEKDKKVIAQYNITNVKEVLYVSTIKDDNYRDNAKLKRILRGEE